MSDLPVVWIVIYTVLLLLPSCAVGAAVMHLPRKMLVPRFSRFLTGFAGTPFLIALWMLLVAAVLPGTSRWTFLIPPAIAGGVYLVRKGPATCSRLWREWRRGCDVPGRRWCCYLILACAAPVVFLVLFKLTVNAWHPLTAHDALVYGNEALEFAKTGALAAIPDFNGGADDVIPGHPHSFLYQAFLSHALMTTGGSVGYPYDLAFRASVQLLFLYMLAAAAGLAAALGLPGMAGLTIIFLFQVANFEYISYAASRDAFRIIPLLLLSVSLIAVSPKRLHALSTPVAYVSVAVFAAFSLLAHTINSIMVGAIGLAWVIWAVVEQGQPKKIMLILSSLFLGCMLAGAHYMKSFWDTGNFMGYGFAYYSFIDTPLWDIFVEKRDVLSLAGATMLKRMTMFFMMDGWTLSVEGIVAAAAFLFLRTRGAIGVHMPAMLFIVLILFLGLVPFSGVLDLTRLKLSDMLLLNRRYILHWYPFAAVLTAGIVSYVLFYRMEGRANRGWIPAASMGLIIIAAALYSSVTVYSSWRMATDRRVARSGILDIRDVLDSLGAEERVLIDDDRIAYYLRKHPVYIYSYPAWDVVRSESDTEVSAALMKLAIDYVVLKKENVPGWWDQTALYRYLTSHRNAAQIYRDGRFYLYKLLW